MAIYTRGKARTVQRAVRCNQLIYYAFNTYNLAEGTGITDADLTAVGHKTLNTIPAGASAIFGMQAPRAARFRKKIGTQPVLGQRGSCTTYGNGSSKTGIAAAAAVGWKLTRPVRLAVPRATIKSKTVGVKLESGIIYLQAVPRQDLAETEVVAALGLILPESFTDADKRKAIQGTKAMAPLRVTRILEGGATQTLPCSHDKMADAAELGFYPSSTGGSSVEETEA